MWRLIKFFKYLKMSGKSLLDHKLRSFLTVLGIIFGVSAVIAMTAIGEGAKAKALKDIQEMGINNVFVDDMPQARRATFEKGGYVTDGLSLQDVKFIADSISQIEKYSLIKQKDLFVQAESFNGNYPIMGTDVAYFEMFTLSAKEGRLFTDVDMVETPKVCVVGAEIAARLFKQSKPLGSYVRINDKQFQIIGILADKPGYENNLYIINSEPLLHETLTSFEASYNRAIFYVGDIPSIRIVSEFIKKILQRRHFGLDDFVMTVPEAQLRQAEKTQNLFNSIMLLITSISLIVGGIGIMNIMLASVLERTKEIGIRRGMGATKLDIQQQFLAEAVVLTSAGGVIGIFIGVALTVIIRYATQWWDMYIPIFAVILSFGFSVLIGVIFGYYPAKNASEMNPIDALRYE